MTKQQKPAEAKPKPRAKKELQELAKKVAHAAGTTEPVALDTLAAQDRSSPGLAPYDLVKAAFGEAKAKAAFSAQQSLPRKRPTGPELTVELCDLEQRLRRARTTLGDALLKEKSAKKAREDAEGAVATIQDSIADALADLRQGQGRIEFPEVKSGKDAAAGERAA
jgi:hypothetical protein